MESEVDDAEVMRLWRQCGLPEYFLGNGGTNVKLVAFVAAAIREDRAERVSEAEVTAARVALINSFMSQVSTSANKPFGETGVSIPLDTIWDTYARNALEAARQARATADEKGGAR